LRWQLTRNQWGRSKFGLRPIVAGIVGVGAGAVGAIAFLGGFFGAIFGLRDATADTIMIVWLAVTGCFLMFWIIGLLVELQRSEAIDLQRLMHLPVLLGQMFVINYVASHFAFSIILTLPAVFGLSIGLAIARGPMMLLLLPLALSMIFMVTAWTYCLRGWLAAMMTNPRKRRSIIVLVTVVIVMIGQLPNLYFNVLGHADTSNEAALRGEMSRLLAAQKFIPPFWVSLGARFLAEGRFGPALLGIIGCSTIGALGLRRAYRSTLKFYHGETGSKASAPRPSKPAAAPLTETVPGKRRARFLETRLPGIPDQASAVALSSIRSMLRAPEVKMAWTMSFVVTAIVGASILLRSSSRVPDGLKPFLLPLVMGLSLLTLVQFLSNQFGFDRDGFRTFVLSPANRREILLGKNLAALPMIACSGLFWLIALTIWLRLSVFTALTGFFQIASMTLIAGSCGNLLSIYLPYRIQAASLKPTKVSGPIGIAMVLSQLIFPLLMFPVFVPPLVELLCRMGGVATAFPINLLLSIGLVLLIAFIYWLTLPLFGRLLQQRETRILELVTAEIE
jgi:ABC-2 type transport system permease protein